MHTERGTEHFPQLEDPSNTDCLHGAGVLANHECKSLLERQALGFKILIGSGQVFGLDIPAGGNIGFSGMGTHSIVTWRKRPFEFLEPLNGTSNDSIQASRILEHGRQS